VPVCFPSLSILVNYEQESSFYVDLHVAPCCELLHRDHVQQSLHSFWGLSKNRDVVDETYVIKLVAVVGVLPAAILVLANLQTMTDPLILSNRREHPQRIKKSVWTLAECEWCAAAPGSACRAPHFEKSFFQLSSRNRL